MKADPGETPGELNVRLKHSFSEKVKATSATIILEQFLRRSILSPKSGSENVETTLPSAGRTSRPSQVSPLWVKRVLVNHKSCIFQNVGSLAFKFPATKKVYSLLNRKLAINIWLPFFGHVKSSEKELRGGPRSGTENPFPPGSC